MKLSTNEIRSRFLDYFKNQDHYILDSVSLVTPDTKGVTDSTLFNTAGVQPLIPYLLGEKHPNGDRLASSQKCVRTIDIDEVGDKTHLTFFEMLGNWSLGDYFKEESIKWSYEFLTDQEKGLGLDPKRLYITVFEGDENAPKDEESFNIWKQYIPENRIYFMGADSNWWEAGENGPCGPDTEMFYDLTTEGLGDMSREGFITADDNQKVVEVWNNVFMQFEKKAGKIIRKLPRHAVDTGAGLERLSIVVNDLNSIYESDNFQPLIDLIEDNSTNFTIESARVIADHLKSAVFMISEKVIPSNTDRGYILRRLIRRAVRHLDQIKVQNNISEKIIELIEKQYKGIYQINKEEVKHVLNNEEEKFRKTLKKGLKEFEKISAENKNISGHDAFKLFSTYGFPLELIIELSKESEVTIDVADFELEMENHKSKSRTAAEGKFKGGLQETGDQEIKYHTTTHLLHQALRDVLGDHVEQKGSNINSERLRFDFSHDTKMTDEEKSEVEKIVNEKISADFPIKRIELPKNEALKTGARHLFTDKYDDIVSIYYIGNNLDDAYSKEFCGGPHVERTGILGKFKIKKEEASSAGVRRIKAILE